MRKIVILGSTGSIGTQALSVIEEHGDMEVTAMSAGRNVSLFEKQIRKHNPKVAAMADEESARELRMRISDLGTEVLSGEAGICEAASCDAELVLGAIVGMAGIKPTIAAIESGKDVALANKETLVCAGHIIMPLAKERSVRILPVDSEHSAIFQTIHGNEGNEIEKILLTASGGPFRGFSRDEIRDVTAKDALKHPNWSMGAKVTIDSATMINKGLEIMEAGWLFNIDTDKIEVYVHPQSIVHSAVEFSDGAVLAQLGVPDMRIPIQYALYYPERPHLSGKRLDLFAAGSLTFEKPDTDVFAGLALARRAAKEGGSMPTVLNSANELANAAFLAGKIKFTQISDIIEMCMDHFPATANPSVSEIFDIRDKVYDYIESAGIL